MGTKPLHGVSFTERSAILTFNRLIGRDSLLQQVKEDTLSIRATLPMFEVGCSRCTKRNDDMSTIRRLGHEHMNYEADSDVYSTLVDLLRSQSQHFASQIDKQEYLYHQEGNERRR